MKRRLSKLWIKNIIWASKHCPPGYRADYEMTTILASLLIAIVFSLVTFGYGFISDCQRITAYNDFLENEAPIRLNQHEMIRNDTLMIIQQIEEDMHTTPFYDLVSKMFLWFLLSGGLVSGAYMISHYLYYRHETKSIYVMMRINSNRLKESYFKVPVWCFLIHIFTCLGLLIVFYASYRIAIGILL